MSRQYLTALLGQLPEVEIVAVAATEEEAVEAIQTANPDLVFLDIELHTGNGFAVLEKTQPLAFAPVFTTALDYRALKMIRLSGMPYLQKPIDADELLNVLNKLREEKARALLPTAVHHLLATIRNNNTPIHIALQGAETTEYILLADLQRLEVEGAVTKLYLKGGAIKKSGMSLKEWEGLLEDFRFFRVAAAHLVNLEQVKGLTSSAVEMKEGSAIPLSSKKREDLFAKLAAL